jgi:hypothetical protein
MTGVVSIEDLHNCRTNAERAAWLLSAPLSLLLCDVMLIRRALMASGFQGGLIYLDAEISNLNRPRNLQALFEPMAIRAARGDLRRIACGAA